MSSVLEHRGDTNTAIVVDHEPAVRSTVKSILVVDDEPIVRRFVRVMLVKAGYTVIEASGGQEALELSRAYQKSIDLTISDITMPGMSGPEFVEQFRLERPKAHILLMSGHAS